ncbi:hypothetical protein TgHK011_010142 [Trichoderma gracile]|nr:hypothetical protein TgHK011_010142 [Trichoderma gracile]
MATKVPFPPPFIRPTPGQVDRSRSNQSYNLDLATRHKLEGHLQTRMQTSTDRYLPSTADDQQKKIQALNFPCRVAQASLWPPDAAEMDLNPIRGRHRPSAQHATNGFSALAMKLEAISPGTCTAASASIPYEPAPDSIKNEANADLATLFPLLFSPSFLLPLSPFKPATRLLTSQL